MTRGGGFVHGFTYSHQPMAATVAREVLRILEAESLVEASAVKGERPTTRPCDRSADDASCWACRCCAPTGRGPLFRDRATWSPRSCGARGSEMVCCTARARTRTAPVTAYSYWTDRYCFRTRPSPGSPTA